jgi:hypothetical protein
LIQVIGSPRLFVLAILHPIIDMAQDGVNGIFLGDIEREERY